MAMIQKSKILITGGAGFVGSNLVDALISMNEIVVVDDLSMGSLKNLPKSPHLHFFKHSITDAEFMQQLLKAWRFDYIYLLAAVASVADTIQRPIATHEINEVANLNILETIKTERLSVQKLLFASSAAVYGNQPELPKAETSPIDPLSPYAIDKFATERFTIDYGRLFDIPTVATRFFNVYGPKQNPSSPYSGVLSLLSDSAKSDTPFTLFGDGEQTRDFVYVKDVVQALILLMRLPEATGRVYNVGTGHGVSLNTIISHFETIVGHKLRVTRTMPRLGDIQKSFADITALTKLGYRANYSIADGLLDYWRSLTTDQSNDGQNDHRKMKG